MEWAKIAGFFEHGYPHWCRKFLGISQNMWNFVTEEVSAFHRRLVVYVIRWCLRELSILSSSLCTTILSMNPAPYPIYFRRPCSFPNATDQHQRPHRYTEVKNFSKNPMGYFKILRGKRVTRNNFRTEGPQILGTTVWNLVARAF